LVKISSVDPEFSLLKGFLKKEINASRTYSPWGMHAARAKIVQNTDVVTTDQ